jgi:hypothetical protein
MKHTPAFNILHLLYAKRFRLKACKYGQTNGSPISLANLQAGIYHLQIFSPELTQQHFKINKID